MKDFYEDDLKENAGKTRTFTFCGEQFVAKPIMSAEDVSTLTDIGLDGNENAASREMFPQINAVIRKTLVPEYREAWDAVVAADRPIPISMVSLSRVASWLLVEEAGRPTEPLSSSGTSGGSGSTTSTEDSGSKAEQASTTSRSVPA